MLVGIFKPFSALAWQGMGYALAFSSLCLAGGAVISGCSTPAGTAALTGGVATGLISAAGRAPAHEVEQIYYVGVFDPEEQVPRSIYRLRVHGQSSPLNKTRFASGWVPSKLIDAFGGQVSIDPNSQGSSVVTGISTNQEVLLPVGKRLWQFGPEASRESASAYRLVIVMGADPGAFFATVDKALGYTSDSAVKQVNAAVQANLYSVLASLVETTERYEKLKQNTGNGIKP